ncbi:MAG: hypothetical protein ACXW18_09850 [Pyrinomonadaceae bacterium]
MLKGKRIIIVSIASATLLVGLLVALSGVTNQNPTAAGQVPFGQSAKQLEDAAAPTVDFDNPTPVDRIDKGARKLKNARYDKYGVVPRNPPPQVSEAIGEPELRASDVLSDLPADKSQLVVEAIVSESRAFLSENKAGVYSEFTIIVSKILNAAPGLSVNPGDKIVAERFGGKVKYPSGQVIRFRYAGQGVPMVGKGYLFFLSKVDQDNYKLLTAYEIQGNKIHALDSSRVELRGQGHTIFDKHNGEDLETFMVKVRKAIDRFPGVGQTAMRSIIAIRVVTVSQRRSPYA